jgi:fructokinase
MRDRARTIHDDETGVRMLNIIAFGEALIDMMPDYPAGRPDGSPPRAFIPYPGGAPANVAVAAARLGGPACFLGQVGNDVFGDMITATLRDYGVVTDHLQHSDDAPTPLAFVAHDSEGERRFSFYRNGTADLLYRQSDAPSELFAAGGVFHICSNTLTETGIETTTRALLDQAGAQGCLRSVDVNFRPNLWHDPQAAGDRIWMCLQRADVVKMSRDELEALYGDVPEDMTLQRLLAAGVRLVIVTDGGHAVRFITPEHQGTVQPPAVNVVDTTAAGDAFVGGLLTTLAAALGSAADLDDWLADASRISDALQFAARCGAFAAGRYGAYEALPTAADVG